jgi:hypothetical protein
MKKPVTQENQKSKAKDLIVTRIFDAPVDEVWKYWSEQKSPRSGRPAAALLTQNRRAALDN